MREAVVTFRYCAGERRVSWWHRLLCRLRINHVGHVCRAKVIGVDMIVFHRECCKSLDVPEKNR